MAYQIHISLIRLFQITSRPVVSHAFTRQSSPLSCPGSLSFLKAFGILDSGLEGLHIVVFHSLYTNFCHVLSYILVLLFSRSSRSDQWIVLDPSCTKQLFFSWWYQTFPSWDMIQDYFSSCMSHHLFFKVLVCFLVSSSQLVPSPLLILFLLD